MAETRLLDAGTVKSPDEEMPHQALIAAADVTNNHPADPDSGGDGEDYSSGSDRSFEGEDVDTNVHGDAPGDQSVSADGQGKGRRKRRHGSHGSRRQKGGSRHKHKQGFHPYPPKEEMKRKSLEIKEKENAAAELRREDGDQEYVTFPAAPFNSTQYLMDEHSSVASPAAVGLHKTSSSSKLEAFNSPNITSSRTTPKLEVGQSNSNWEKSNQKENKEFSEIYTTVHAESLQSLPKEELVKHYMNLEEQVAVLQKKVAEQKKKDMKMDDNEKDMNCDSASVSDTNSLSSANEEFVDLATVNQPTITVGDSDDPVQPSKSKPTVF